MKNNHIPKIRFPGFTGDWDQRSLGNISTKIGSGKTPKGGDKNYISSGIPLLRSQNIFNDKVNLDKAVYISPDIDEDMANSRVQKGDVLLNITGASIGRSAVYNLTHRANVNQHVSIIRPFSEVNPYFVQLNLTSEKGQKQIELNQAGGGREGLNFQQIAKMSFYFPSLEEQDELAHFFKQLDDLIALHQQELTTLKQSKQGFLQKMFPKEGESVPEVRFREFTGKWEDYRLSDIGSTYTGLSGKTKEDFGTGEGKFVTYMNVFTNVIAKEDSGGLEKVNISDGKQQNRIVKGDLLFTTSSETPEEVGMVSYWGGSEDNVYLNSFCFGYRITVPSVDPLFLAYLLRSGKYRLKIAELAQGSTRYNLSKTELLKLMVEIPSLEEQWIISNFIQQLDDTIALHERELDILKEMKKAFLQKMFV